MKPVSRSPSPRDAALAIALTTIGYVAASRLGAMLTPAPGLVPAMSPEAGIALGAALIARRRGILGVALGALASNLLQLFGAAPRHGSGAFVAALLVAAGATAQAAAGAAWIRRAVGTPVTLVRDAHVVAFTLLGPAACALGAAFTTAADAPSGAESTPLAFALRWSSGALGVLVVAPITLAFFGRPADLWRRRRLPIAVPALLVVSATIAAFVATRRSEAREQHAELERKANDLHSAFRVQIVRASDSVRACDALYLSSDEVTRAEFSTFTRSLLEMETGVDAFLTAERVEDARRDAFEQSMRSQGAPAFELTELEQPLAVVAAHRRPEYLVVTAIEPDAEYHRAVGLDLGSRPATQRAIEQMIATGGLVALEPSRMLRGPDDLPSVAIYLPRFARGEAIDTPDRRKAALRGFTGAILRIGELVGSSRNADAPNELALRLVDVTDPTAPIVLFDDGARADAAKRTARVVAFGGRRWSLEIGPNEAAIARAIPASWFVLSGGLLLTGLLGGFLLVLTGRATLIASIVHERTRELSAANQALAHEQAVTLNVMEELKHARDAATEGERSKSAFLANMSHEIRTPMTAILGFAELLRDPALAPTDRRSFVEVIRRNGEHLLEMLNGILDLSKVEADKLAVEKIPCAVDEIVRDVEAMVRPRAEQKGLALRVTVDAEVSLPIRSDPVRIRQVLLNLLSNAIKFTERGEITVRASRGQRLEIAVSDTGIGMSATELEHVFEPFSQADASTTRRFGGTGLGLTISQHLVALLGGRLDARSEPGVGTTFVLSLPVEEAGEFAGAQTGARPAPPPTSHAAALRGKRVLVAEDGVDVRELLRRVLEEAELEVTIVDDGQALIDAVARARDAPFDLLLVDMQMPVLDGYRAVRRLRAEGFRGPILALTAHTDAADRQACLDAGADDHLKKPVGRRELVGRIAEALGVSASTSAPPSERRSFADLEGHPLVEEMLPLFLTGLGDALATLAAATRDRDEATSARALHTIKGSAAMFGFDALSALAVEASSALEADPWGEVFDAAVSRLSARADRIRERGLADRLEP